MARLCERPGCSAPADVAYGFDAELLVVWLDGFQAAQGARSGVLCRRHADAMVVPLGWMLDDRREPVPRLFKAPTEVPVRQRPRRVRAERDVAMEQLTLDTSSGDDAGNGQAMVSAVAEPDPTPAMAAADVGERPDQADDQADVAVVRAVDEPLDVDHGDVEPVQPWQPVFDEHDDLAGLLKARGRLLSRAFGGITPADPPADSRTG